MRVLVTGAGGQVGRELVAAFARHVVVAADRSVLDVTDPAAIRAVVASARPDWVVNAAAWTDVDGCEADPDRAMLVNGHAVGWLAEACTEAGARLCQISTDHVFDGLKGEPYVESDEVGPVNAYGRSKLVGERAAGPLALVVRTSWVFSAGEGNAVTTVLRLAAREEVLHFVDDQFGSPTAASDLAATIGRLVRDDRAGVVHVANAGVVSRFELAREVLRAAGLDPERVRPIHTRDLPRPAPRPSSSALASEVLPAWGCDPLDDFREPLRRLVAEHQRRPD